MLRARLVRVHFWGLSIQKSYTIQEASKSKFKIFILREIKAKFFFDFFKHASTNLGHKPSLILSDNKWILKMDGGEEKFCSKQRESEVNVILCCNIYLSARKKIFTQKIPEYKILYFKKLELAKL